MKNKQLAKKLDYLKRDTESVIDDLLKEIEDLESELKKANDKIDELNDILASKIENL